MRNFVVLFMLILGACTPTTEQTQTPGPAELSQRVAFVFDDLTIELEQLPGWDVYVKTNNKLLMAEVIDNPSPTHGKLDRVLIHIWVPTISDADISYDLDSHSIAEILDRVLTTYEVHDAMEVNTPTTLDWAGHDAAYYTLIDQHHNLSLVIALKVADQHFIAVNISAPLEKKDQIRQTLPLIFDPFLINGEHLNNDALNELPSPLIFPELQTDNTTE